MLYFRRSLWGLGLFAALALLVIQETEDFLWCNARVISKVPTTHKVVALTFDDGA